MRRLQGWIDASEAGGVSGFSRLSIEEDDPLDSTDEPLLELSEDVQEHIQERSIA